MRPVHAVLVLPYGVSAGGSCRTGYGPAGSVSRRRWIYAALSFGQTGDGTAADAANAGGGSGAVLPGNSAASTINCAPGVCRGLGRAADTGSDGQGRRGSAAAWQCVFAAESAGWRCGLSPAPAARLAPWRGAVDAALSADRGPGDRPLPCPAVAPGLGSGRAAVVLATAGAQSGGGPAKPVWAGAPAAAGPMGWTNGLEKPGHVRRFSGHGGSVCRGAALRRSIPPCYRRFHSGSPGGGRGAGGPKPRGQRSVGASGTGGGLGSAPSRAERNCVRPPLG